jgi:penicillin-binding protein-related factor A (putative recombinase)
MMPKPLKPHLYPCVRCFHKFELIMDRNQHQIDCRNTPIPQPKRSTSGTDLEKIVRDSVESCMGLSIDQVSPRFVGQVFPDGRVSGRFAGKGLLDFVGDLHGQSVYFDAKSCDGTNIPLSRLEPHQIARVERGHERGAITFFLVAFQEPKPRYFALTWPMLAPFLDEDRKPAGRKSIPLSFFTDVASVAIEIHPIGKTLDLLTVIRMVSLRTKRGVQ